MGCFTNCKIVHLLLTHSVFFDASITGPSVTITLFFILSEVSILKVSVFVANPEWPSITSVWSYTSLTPVFQQWNPAFRDFPQKSNPPEILSTRQDAVSNRIHYNTSQDCFFFTLTHFCSSILCYFQSWWMKYSIFSVTLQKSLHSTL